MDLRQRARAKVHIPRAQKSNVALRALAAQLASTAVVKVPSMSWVCWLTMIKKPPQTQKPSASARKTVRVMRQSFARRIFWRDTG